MDVDERPLLVQLNWTTDNREARFVLKRDQDSSKVKINTVCAVFQTRSQLPWYARV